MSKIPTYIQTTHKTGSSNKTYMKDENEYSNLTIQQRTKRQKKRKKRKITNKNRKKKKQRQ